MTLILILSWLFKIDFFQKEQDGSQITFDFIIDFSNYLCRFLLSGNFDFQPNNLFKKWNVERLKFHQNIFQQLKNRTRN